MCDESWAMSLRDTLKNQQTTFSLPYYFGVSSCLYLTLVSFTFLGALFGEEIGDLHKLGFDMAFIAVFLVLLRGMYRSAKEAIPWLISLVVAGLVYLMIPGAWYVAAGTIAGLLFIVLTNRETV